MALRKDTAACLYAALRSASEMIRDGNDVVAVAAVGSQHRLFLGHDYWSSDQESRTTFEHRVAREALAIKENFGALVVPLLYSDGEGGTFRDPHGALIAGESHVLWGLTWHEREGFDLHRVFYSRRPNGEPVFDSLQSLDGAVKLPPAAPGAALIRSAIQHHGGNS